MALNRRTFLKSQILFVFLAGVLSVWLPFRALAEESFPFPAGSVLLAESGGVLTAQVTTTSSRTVEAFVLSEPDRLVIDIVGSELERRHEYTPVSIPSVLKVRFGHHPEKLRIVFDLRTGMVLKDMEVPLTKSGVEHSYIIAEGRFKIGPPRPEVKIPAPDPAVVIQTKETRVVRPPVFYSVPTAGLRNPGMGYDRKTPLQRLETAAVPLTEEQLAFPVVLPRTELAEPANGERQSKEKIDSAVDGTSVLPLETEKRIARVKPAAKELSPAYEYGQSDPAVTIQALFDEGQSGPRFNSTDIALCILLGLLLLVLVATRMKQRRIRLTRDRVFPHLPEAEPGEDWFAVLGCAQDASNSVIKSRYRHLVKVYHRDSLEHETVSEEVRRLSESQLVRVHEAYKQVRQERGF